MYHSWVICLASPPRNRQDRQVLNTVPFDGPSPFPLWARSSRSCLRIRAPPDPLYKLQDRLFPVCNLLVVDMATPAASVEINDALFCQAHLKEVCEDCSFDGREDNDAFFGFDPIDRDGLEAPLASPNKDGVYQCKKHTSPTCNQCFGWKKQLTRARAAAKKAGKKSGGSSNFV
ncbi:hypothetical protein NM688_g7066 [Phlebia brevispora]|uniref:Uncharacterized protein n=1 Tax=Phlebia brevispora TaxID=194682 RepID=A0ACC1S9D0_9APHY|nr:hypothetical protein NM688_g7066 [Phlebia brevispora]